MATRRRTAALVLAGLWLAGCSPDRPAVSLDSGIVVVENHTRVEWRQVVVTVNDHFRGGSPTLAPGGRLTAPLSGFQTAFGQRFESARQKVAKIEVTATDAAGQPVALSWAGEKSR